MSGVEVCRCGREKERGDREWYYKGREGREENDTERDMRAGCNQ